MNILTIALAALTLLSPDGRIAVNIDADKKAPLSYSVDYYGEAVLAKSEIALTLADGTVWGGNAKPSKVLRRSVDETFATPVYKRSAVRDNYNELELRYKAYKVVFRAYDDGVAYRFLPLVDATVKDEKAEFNFASDGSVFIPYTKYEDTNPSAPFQQSFENLYSCSKISECKPDGLAFLPVAVKTDACSVCITESDLLNYPGMFLANTDSDTSLEGKFAPKAKKVVTGGFEMIEDYVMERYDYIALVKAGDKLPWRVLGVGADDTSFAVSDLVYKLATPAADVDWSWVKPGKVAWEWWHDWNIKGVDFKAGINTRTYEYYIDFAAEYGLEYMLVDAGWNVHDSGDLFAVVPEMDIPYLAKYAEDRGVGLVLWAGYSPFNRDMEEVCAHYSAMGVKGFKIDFMERDDQDMVDFHRRAAETAAKYHLILDFHGTYKPAGINRTYPNVLTIEAVYAQENNKWAYYEIQSQPAYDCTLPFVRMFAGPIDYNTGAYRNATEWNYRPIHTEPMTYGTRTHQVAEYLVFDCYFQMLVDDPGAYRKDDDCTRFIAAIPEVWDESICLEGDMSKYVLLARRNGDVWYLGGLTDWEYREFKVYLDFLPAGRYKVTICRDGVNANKNASDYKVYQTEVSTADPFDLYMMPGGGYVARFEKI